MADVWPYLAAILPTILVAILFYFLVKSMLEGDRRERLAQRRWEAEQDRAEEMRSARSAADSAGAQGSVPDRPAGTENARNHGGEPVL
jgi:bacterioferritin (cytochrome b1)